MRSAPDFLSYDTFAPGAPKNTPTGAEINAAVDSDLLYDSSVSANDLDVTTIDGIVTLSGSAPNILAKERAATIAEAVKGVRTVVNKITVKPVSRTDEEVRKDVEAALLTDPAADSYEVNTTVKDGGVTLTGKVESWQEKQLSGAVAKGVKGVKKLQNDISVSYQTDRLDSEIAAEVKAVLERDVWVDDNLINATVSDGKVTLTGIVGSVAEKTRAESDAWIPGVNTVDSDGLKVEPWAKDTMRKNKIATKTDEEIKQAIEDGLLLDPRVNSFNPSVAVNNSIVTLTGTVDNLKAKRAAEQDAKNTVGVWRVKNYLRVRTENPPSSDKLAQNVKDALTRDPYVDRFQIGVSSLNGVISLTGTVDSYYEKSHAEDIVSRVNGVTDVNNGLEVSFTSYKHYYWPYSEHYYEPYYYNHSNDYTVLPYTSDAEVKDEIKSEFFWSPFVDTDAIEVKVENGTATLTGTVDNWSEYQSASENAKEGGADIVINKLKIQ